MKINFSILTFVMISLCAQAETLSMHYSGDMRLGTQYHDREGSSGMDAALGGNLHLETTALSGISLGARLHTSNVLFNQNEAFAVPFYGTDAQSYAILSEAYIKGELDNTSIILGRQTLDTPFLDSDDRGMVANTFEAYTLVNHDVSDLQLVYSFVRNMSGVDADVPEKFSDINGGSGIHVLGLSYEGLEHIRLDTWVYKTPSFTRYAYFEAGYENVYKAFSYTLGAQFALEDFKRDECKILGVSGSVSDKKSALTLLLAYNSSSGTVAENGFGGGPFFTSSEHMTLAEAGEDGEVFSYGLEWEVTQNQTLSFFKTDLYDGYNHDGYEVDIVANYSASENLSFDAIYSKIDNTNVSGDKFDNFRFFANYSF